ncbi:MAG: glycosyltransferase family 39 protein [Chloroflexota bacterium]
MTQLPLRLFISLFVISLIIRFLAALPQEHPYTMDEAYSYVNAVTLTAGDGFVEHFIWNYLNPPETLPQPSNYYWMPLTSFVASIGLMIGGVSYPAAQWGFIVLSSLLAPFTALIAWKVSTQKRHAWVAGLMMIFSGFYFWAWTIVDNFTPFALAGSMMLYMFWDGIETKRNMRLIGAGVLAGLAHLARADGPLLLVTAFLFLLGSTVQVVQTNKEGQSFQSVMMNAVFGVVLLMLGYLVIMMPWFLRNILLTGVPLAPGGNQTIWLQSYNDLFSYGRAFNLQSYLDWGIDNIIRSKLWALGQNLQRVLAETGMIFALPLAVIGGWQLRHHRLFQLCWLYYGLLFIAMTFVFTYPGVRGALFHSSGAILPFLLTATVIGLDKLVESIARRRRTWRVKPAQTVFSIGLVGLAIFLSFIAYAGQVSQVQQLPEQTYAQVTDYLTNQNATVMVGNPPAYIYYGGYQAIITPNEKMDIVLQVADRYQATHLILDQNHPPPLSEYYTQSAQHPRLNHLATFSDFTHLFQILP